MTRTEKSASTDEPVESHTPAVAEFLDLLARLIARKHVREQVDTTVLDRRNIGSNANGNRPGMPSSHEK